MGSHHILSICPHLALHFHPAGAIIEIIYHYYGREEKIVSTDDNDEGSVQGLSQLVEWRNASLQDVGLICPKEHMQTKA